MKHLFLILLGLLLYFSITAQTAPAFKGEVLRNAGYAVYVIDAESGVPMYATPQISLVPASVMKIVTTATAMEVLGAGFTFHTRIGYTGKVDAETGVLDGNLVLKGGCDPAFYSEYFPEFYNATFEGWARALSVAGIKRINGNFIVDLSQMKGQSIPGGWLWEDIGNYYGSGVSALSYADNYYNIHFSSPVQSGFPVKISRTAPIIKNLILKSKVLSSDINRDLAVVYGSPGSYSQVVEGTIPKGYSDFVVKAAAPDPAQVAVNEFMKVLKQHNIELSGNVLYADHSPDEAFVMVGDKSSPPLSELIVPLNRESLNLYAEHLLRELGRMRKGSSTLESGLEVVNEFWTEKGIFLNGFYPSDGSGLSRSNGISPRTLAEILRYMALGSNSDLFFNSLPMAGRTGTLQSAFKGTKLENNLRAKTGSMTRVRSMAGIFTNKTGKKVIFAIITNNFEGTQSVVGRTLEDFLLQLYDYNPEAAAN